LKENQHKNSPSSLELRRILDEAKEKIDSYVDDMNKKDKEHKERREKYLDIKKRN